MNSDNPMDKLSSHESVSDLEGSEETEYQASPLTEVEKRKLETTQQDRKYAFALLKFINTKRQAKEVKFKHNSHAKKKQS